jgi:hypothetical protein
VSAAGLAADFRRALDPTAIAYDLGIVPDPWQQALLEDPPKRVLLCCGRQTGKSTTVALVALHEAIYQAPALTLLVSPSLRQSMELFRKLHDFWQRLPDRPEADYETLSRLELANGSRILSLPGNERTVRGLSAVDLIILDEAAGVEDELLVALRPMLATSGGKMFALSTPKGKRGWFYETWTNGIGWRRVMVKSTECSRIDPLFLEEERAAQGPLMFGQEYLCEFHDDASHVFTTELIERAVSNDFELLFPV